MIFQNFRLIFSQSLYSLTLIEEFLHRINQANSSQTDSQALDGNMDTWLLGHDYYRLDGSTPAAQRSKWCKEFNSPKNIRGRLFLISTKAGGLGINLTAANRVIIFDASWNPSHDTQSIFRVYRYTARGTIYRLLLLLFQLQNSKVNFFFFFFLI